MRTSVKRIYRENTGSIVLSFVQRLPPVTLGETSAERICTKSCPVFWGQMGKKELLRDWDDHAGVVLLISKWKQSSRLHKQTTAQLCPVDKDGLLFGKRVRKNGSSFLTDGFKLLFFWVVIYLACARCDLFALRQTWYFSLPRKVIWYSPFKLREAQYHSA